MTYEDKIAAEHKANTIFQNCKYKPLAIVFDHAQESIDTVTPTIIDAKG